MSYRLKAESGRLRGEGDLTVQETFEKVFDVFDRVLDSNWNHRALGRLDTTDPNWRAAKTRTCSNCGQPGHNARRCLM